MPVAIVAVLECLPGLLVLVGRIVSTRDTYLVPFDLVLVLVACICERSGTRTLFVRLAFFVGSSPFCCYLSFPI